MKELFISRIRTYIIQVVDSSIQRKLAFQKTIEKMKKQTI